MRAWFLDNPRLRWRFMLASLPLWALLGLLGGWWIQSRPVPGATTPEVRAPDRDPHAGQAVGRPLESYQVIWSRPLRQQLLESNKKVATPKPQDRSLQWHLIGTAVEGPRSYALLRSRDGQIRVAAVGDQLDTFYVHSIQPQQVGLWRDGATRYLQLPQALRRLVPDQAAETRKAVAELEISNAGSTVNEAKTESAEVEDSGPRPPHPPIELLSLSAERFMDEVRLVPAMGGSLQSGFRIDSLAEGGRIASAGLRPGDLIAAVDDQALKELGDLKRLIQSLKSGEAHQWRIVRGKKILTVHIVPEVQDSES